MRLRSTLILILLVALPPAFDVAPAAARAVPRPPHPPQTRRAPSAIEQAVFGPFTQQALRTFQRAYDLPATGVADRGTYEALELQFRGVLKPGARGLAVAALQGALAEKAFWPEARSPVDTAIAAARPLAARKQRAVHGPVPPPLPRSARLDGAYGAMTTRAVKAFQRHAGLRPSGQADAATLAALGLKGAALGPGARGERVLALQRVLVVKGFWGR